MDPIRLGTERDNLGVTVILTRPHVPIDSSHLERNLNKVAGQPRSRALTMDFLQTGEQETLY